MVQPLKQFQLIDIQTTLFTNEQLLPVIDHVFAFTDVVAALQYMANNQNIGKLILKH